MGEAWDNPLRDDESVEISPPPKTNDDGDDLISYPYETIPPSQAISVEELTLAEMIGALVRAPAETWPAFQRILRTPKTTTATTEPPPAVFQSTIPVRLMDVSLLRAVRGRFDENLQPLTQEQNLARQHEGTVFWLRLAALLIGLYGSSILMIERVEQFGLEVGKPYLLLAFLFWLISEIYDSWPSIHHWWHTRNINDESVDSSSAEAETPSSRISFSDWVLERGAWAGAALAFSLMAAAFNAGNRFTLLGVLAWFASVALWVSAFAPPEWTPRRIWSMLRGIRIERNGTFWMLVVIILVGAFFRLSQLTHVPPEMSSDHVEKLLDAQRVLDGDTQVFFPNNGGREPFQMYAMALLSRIPGLGVDFTTLKLLTAIEGLIMLPVLWWMGRVVIGRDNPRLGNLVGLALAALVAVSYWHIALSRLGLRIVLTVLVAALLIIFLTRALRYNKRGDFILAGLTLGFGMYTYQAVRMMPVVVLIGIGLVLLFKARSLVERRTYTLNFAVLVLVALAAFVPLLTFSLQYPNHFWMRTSGRLLGDDIIITRNEQGGLIERYATLQERAEAFQKNLPVLVNNIRNALLMYNWKGDVLWFSAAPNRPAMDMLTGTLLILGLAAWLARMFRRRDVADWLLPIMLFVMLLPSAFSIAYPIENPSATRTSGTLPEAYLFAALPLALMASSLAKLVRGKRGLIAGGTLAGAALLIAGSSNYRTYFTDYYNAYHLSSPAPYTQAGAFLKGFADSGGALGNAFMLGYRYWWDYRAIGIEAGVMDWPNGIVDPDGDTEPKSAADEAPRFLYLASQANHPYRFNPEEDILFFYSPADLASERRLQELFPTGYARLIRSDKPHNDFKVYRVPAMGTDAFIDFVIQTGAAG